MQPINFQIVKSYFSNLPKAYIFGALALLILSYFGFLETWFGIARVQIDQYNSAYLAASEKHALKNFFELSGLLSILAVLKTSSAGFSFFVDMEIQYGNLLYPLFSLVEKGWYISLASLAIIEFIKLALDYSYLLFPILSYFLFGSYFVSFFFQKTSYQDFTQKARRLALCLFVAINVLSPIYVVAMGAVSQKINAPLKEKIDQELFALKAQLPEIDHKSITQYSKKYVSDSEDSSSDIKSKLDSFSTVISRYILIELISIVLIPFSFLFLIYYIFKRLKHKAIV